MISYIAVSLHFNCIPMHLGSNLCFLFSDRLEMTEPGGGTPVRKGLGRWSEILN